MSAFFNLPALKTQTSTIAVGLTKKPKSCGSNSFSKVYFRLVGDGRGGKSRGANMEGGWIGGGRGSRHHRGTGFKVPSSLVRSFLDNRSHQYLRPDFLSRACLISLPAHNSKSARAFSLFNFRIFRSISWAARSLSRGSFEAPEARAAKAPVPCYQEYNLFLLVHLENRKQ